MWALLRFKERLVKVLMDINIAKDVKGGVSSQNVVSHLLACRYTGKVCRCAAKLCAGAVKQSDVQAAVSCLMCVQLAAAGIGMQPDACAAMPPSHTRGWCGKAS